MDHIKNLIINYGSYYWKPLILATIIVNIIYYIVGNWEWLLAINNCMTLNRLGRGNIGKCFNTINSNTTVCQDLTHGYTYGWCNDQDNYGPLPGTQDGPYGSTCVDWSWVKTDCPPVECSGKYPYGIADQTPYQRWGWCADPGVNRAMRGKQCGPTEGTCNNWIWDQALCPKTCGKRRPQAIKVNANAEEECGTVCGNIGGKNIACPPKCKPKTKTKKAKCQNLCGLVNGIWVNCPPPPCESGDKCICSTKKNDSTK
jgi:hypothetical protein